MNAITYARVSTEEQAENGFSLRHQEDALKRYCQNKSIAINLFAEGIYTIEEVRKKLVPQGMTLNKLLKSFRFTPEVIELYRQIIQDVFKTNEGDKKGQIETLQKEIQEINSKLVKTEDSYFSDKISVETLNRVSERYKHQMNEVVYRMSSICKDYSKVEKRKTDKNVGQSYNAPPQGLEPWTL